MLTEREAWRVIRDAYATPREERTILQGRLTNSGICIAAGRLADIRMIDEGTYLRLSCLSKAAITCPGIEPYMAPINCPEGDAVRVAFCDEQIKRLEASK